MIPGILSRPRATLLATICLAGLGLIAAWHLPMSLMPSHRLPTLFVWVSGLEDSVEQNVAGGLGRLEGQIRQQPEVRTVETYVTPRYAWLEVSYRPSANLRAAELRLRALVDELAADSSTSLRR